MDTLTTNSHGNQEPGQAKGSRETAARLTDGARGSKKENQREHASPKPNGDKIVEKPLQAEKTPVSKAQRTDYTREAKTETKQGPASTKPGRNNIAKMVTTNKKVDDCLKKGKQYGATRARMEKNRARGKPLPKRGAVTKASVREMAASMMKVIDTGKAFCCAPESFDVDTFVLDLPSPTKSEPTATLWAKVEVREDSAQI